MVKNKKPTAPAPQSQNIVNCLFSKRHVKLEKDADDDEPQEPPVETQEPSPIGEPETQEPAQETQVPPEDVLLGEPPEASLGP
jgi:hypothetical protein